VVCQDSDSINLLKKPHYLLRKQGLIACFAASPCQAKKKMNPKILLITDRADLARLTAQALIQSGIEVVLIDHTFVRSKSSSANLNDYELVLVNLFDEERDSYELCRRVRGGYYGPILTILYGRDERALLRAYEAGADDCLVQPLSIHLLMAKVQAWLRRAGTMPATLGAVEVYNFRFDPARSEVLTPEENLVRLSQLEARLLHLLMINSGSIVETDLIIQRVWIDNYLGDSDRQLLKALVHRLRRKIEADPTNPQYIHTVPNRGYSFYPE
jgi:DNA-binding response OmpR family regulator